MAFGV
jgi:hypothetical protein